MKTLSFTPKLHIVPLNINGIIAGFWLIFRTRAAKHTKHLALSQRHLWKLNVMV